MVKEHYLYKYVYNDEIIYIGKTNSNLKQRILSHANEDKFQPYIEDANIYIMKLANSTEVNALEMLLINKYSPILNYADKHDKTSNIQFTEPIWNTYESYLDSYCIGEVNLKSIKSQKTKCIRHIDKLYRELLLLENKKKELIPDHIINPILIPKENRTEVERIEHKREKIKESIKRTNKKRKYYDLLLEE